MTDEKRQGPVKPLFFRYETSHQAFDASGNPLRNVLVREDPGSGRLFRLDIVNVDSSVKVTLRPLSTVDDGRNFHFRLRFEAGALVSQAVSVVGEDWLLKTVTNQSGTDLYLAWRSPSVTLKPHDRLVVQLRGVSAEPGSFTRVSLRIAWPAHATMIMGGPPPAMTFNPPILGPDYEVEHNLNLVVLEGSDVPRPILFRHETSYELFNASGERLRNVLLRDDPHPARLLQLDLVNALGWLEIILSPLATVDERNFHFHLRFAAGAQVDQAVGVAGADWLLKSVTNESGTDLYLAWCSPPVTLKPRDRLVVQLRGVSAGPGSVTQLPLTLAWPALDPMGAPNAVMSGNPLPAGWDYEMEHNLDLGVLDWGSANIPLQTLFQVETSYELFNARGEQLRNVLLRGDPHPGRLLQIGIVNAHRSVSITLNPLATVDERNFHFHLRFEAGAQVDQAVGVAGAEWRLKRGTKRSGTDLYLAWRGQPVTLEPGDRLAVQLHGVSAGPGSFTQIPLTLAWPSVEQPDAVISLTPRPSEGTYELKHDLDLDVLDRRGRPNIPLRARFVGSNQVLNVDNKENTLTLRLFNSARGSGSQEVLRFRYDADHTDLSSRLVVALPVGTAEHQPWALGTEDQVNGVVIALEGWSVSPPKRSTDGDRVEWELTPTRDVDLPPQGYLNVTLSQLKTGHPSGPADLELRYRGVTGYWDGEIVCAIEKAPLVFGRGDKKDSVGVGDSDPDSRLCVEGGHLRLNGGAIEHEGTLVFRSDAGGGNDAVAAKFFNKEEPLLELSSKGDLRLNGGEYQHRGTLVFRSDTDNGNHTVAAQFLKKDEQAPLLELSSEGALELKRGRFRDKTGFVIPVGTIVAFGGEQAPAGWLMCQGQEVSRTQYADLFQVIRTNYGSAASNSFKLPELKARVPIGSDSNYRIGTTGGEASVQLTVAHMPSHTHVMHDPGHVHRFRINYSRQLTAPNVSKASQASNAIEDYSTDSVRTGVTLGYTGNGQAHNNMQPYTVVNFIIKY